MTAMHMKMPPKMALFSGLSPSNIKAHIMDSGTSLMDMTDAMELDMYLRALETIPKASVEVQSAMYRRPM